MNIPAHLNDMKAEAALNFDSKIGIAEDLLQGCYSGVTEMISCHITQSRVFF